MKPLILLLICTVYAGGPLYKDGRPCNCDRLKVDWYDEESTQVMQETPFIGNDIEGVRKQYYQQGMIMAETEFKNSLREGVAFVFDTVGNVLALTHYVNGKKEGLEYDFISGIPVKEYVWNNDVLVSSRPCHVPANLMNETYCP